MLIPLYGQQDAGAIWNRTYNEYVTDGKGPLAFERCSNDPCVYGKRTRSGGQINNSIYVDDGRLAYDSDAKTAAEGRACAKPTAAATTTRRRVGVSRSRDRANPLLHLIGRLSKCHLQKESRKS